MGDLRDQEVRNAWEVVDTRWEELSWSVAIIGASIKRRDALVGVDALNGTRGILDTLLQDLDWFVVVEEEKHELGQAGSRK